MGILFIYTIDQLCILTIRLVLSFKVYCQAGDKKDENDGENTSPTKAEQANN